VPVHALLLLVRSHGCWRNDRVNINVAIKRDVLVIPKGFPWLAHHVGTQTFCQQKGRDSVEAGQSDWERKVGLFPLRPQF